MGRERELRVKHKKDNGLVGSSKDSETKTGTGQPARTPVLKGGERGSGRVELGWEKKEGEAIRGVIRKPPSWGGNSAVGVQKC